jgi:hypothetical protein
MLSTGYARVHRFGTVATAFLPSLLLVCMAAPAHSEEQPAIQCVEKTAPAKPPPFPGRPRRARGGKRSSHDYGRDLETPAAAPKPLCPEGQVPLVKELKPQEPGLRKGNPLLAPSTGRDMGPMKFRSFNEVYGKRRLRSESGPPPGPPGAPPCDGIANFGSCFY